MKVRIGSACALLLVGSALVASSCGGDDADGSGSGPSAGESGSGPGAGEGGSGGTSGTSGTTGGRGGTGASGGASDSGAGGEAGETGGGGESTGGSDAQGGQAGASGGDGGSGGGDPENPCQGADDGTPCGGRLDICIDEECVASRCGDGFVDELTGEQCDDANDDPGDGCESTCMPSCTPENDECDDADPCNGVESCGSNLACVATEPMDCDDLNPCTADSCDAVLGCLHDLIDGDGDGHASTSIGSCGGDCNDTEPSIHPGAADPCDGIDNICNGETDEDGVATWWEDCDGDGYAAGGAAVQVSCAKPTQATSCAGGDWVTTNPEDTEDCDDDDPAIRPGATELVGDQIDQNCDGLELCYRDNDNDGSRTTSVMTSTDTDCNDPGEARNNEPAGDCSGTPGNPLCDCNDNNSTIRPGLPEVVGDQIDQNCDRRETCYRDTDDDGYRTAATIESLDTDCVDPGEARVNDPTTDCNDGNPNINPGRAEICNDIDDNCRGGIDEGLSVAADNEEVNSQWFSSNALQAGGPSLPGGTSGQSSVVSPPGTLTFHSTTDVDHYVWDQAYATWNPGFQPRWMCRVTGLRSDQRVVMRVGMWRPGGNFNVSTCSSPSNMTCFSHLNPGCLSVANGGTCSTGLLTNPSAGGDLYGFGVSVTPLSGFDHCDADYDVECKLTESSSW